MRIVFAGPSLHGADWTAKRGGDAALEVRGPACQGDIAQAVVEGASVIGLIDGRFEHVAAVWHKEILYGLEAGVQIFGAASMGALRAAECAAFGMIGIGTVYQRYAYGELHDDAAVAQLHAPAEFGYAPLTEALVNVEPTLEGLLHSDRISLDEADRLAASAREIFFKERTYDEILLRAGLSEGARGAHIRAALASQRINVKARDAVQLLSRVMASPAERQPRHREWRLMSTATWASTLRDAESRGPSLAA